MKSKKDKRNKFFL